MRNKVLVVDDEPDVVQLLSVRLTNDGYEVFKAYSGKEALDIARTKNPDLVILDIMMPGLDGSRTAAMLKEDPATKDIPVIFLTCLFTKEDEQKGTLHHGTYFVAKPYDGKRLLDVIRKNIRK